MALLAPGALAADVEQHLGRLIGERRPVLVALRDLDPEPRGDMAQRAARDLAVAEVQRAAQDVLQRLLAADLDGGGCRNAGTGDGPHAFEGLDLEAREALQHPELRVGPNRHHRLRVCGEDPVAHRREAAGEALRVAEDLGA